MAAKKNQFIEAVSANPLVAYSAGGLILYWVVGKPLLKWLGIQKSDAEIENDTIINTTGNAFDPNYWKKNVAKLILTDTAANNYAATIRASFSFYQDNEDQVLGVFRSLKTKAQVSQVADKFKQLYGYDLVSWLRGGSWPDDRLDESELNNIVKLVNSLPDYKP